MNELQLSINTKSAPLSLTVSQNIEPLEITINSTLAPISMGNVGMRLPGLNGTDGREVELGRSETHVRWRYVGDEEWIELYKITDMQGGAGSGGVDFIVGENLKLEDGVLSVVTTNFVERDNTKPITSAGVHVQLGNIKTLLELI